MTEHDSDLVSAIDVAREAGLEMSGQEPLLLEVGQVITCRMKDASVRRYEIVVTGMAKDVMLRRLD